MKSLNDILSNARNILRSSWRTRNGYQIPTTSSVSLERNEAVKIEGAVLYADLAGSSKLTQGYYDYFVAEIYKSFLSAASDVIRNNGGEITAFDGDRVMSVFIGDMKCTNAAKAALQIYHIVKKINELIAEKYPTTSYRIDYGVGMDCSNLYVVRTGVRGDSDLAWIGDASNVAAKLSNLRGLSGRSFMTKRMFDRIADSSKYSIDSHICMWNLTTEVVLGHPVYQSTWSWSF